MEHRENKCPERNADESHCGVIDVDEMIVEWLNISPINNSDATFRREKRERVVVTWKTK